MKRSLAELFKQANIMPREPMLGSYYATPETSGANVYSDIINPMAWMMLRGPAMPVVATAADYLGNELAARQAVNSAGRQGYNMGWTNPFLEARSE